MAETSFGFAVILVLVLHHQWFAVKSSHLQFRVSMLLQLSWIQLQIVNMDEIVPMVVRFARGWGRGRIANTPGVPLGPKRGECSGWQ